MKYIHCIPKPLYDFLSVRNLVPYFPYFIAGTVIKKCGLYKRLTNVSWLFVICIAIIYWLADYRYIIPYGNYIYVSSIIYVVLYICEKLALIESPVKNVLLNLGSKTLYIYVFHYFITYTLDMTYLSNNLIRINNFWVDFALSLSISCLIISIILFFTKILLADKKLANILFYISDK